MDYTVIDFESQLSEESLNILFGNKVESEDNNSKDFDLPRVEIFGEKIVKNKYYLNMKI